MPRWPASPLSTRELQVLTWAARGKTYAETAQILNLSPGTIKTYLDAGRYKLAAINLAQATAVAVATGLISCEDVLAGSLLRADNKPAAELSLT